jgi:uncharacterized protein with HEPN domain
MSKRGDELYLGHMRQMAYTVCDLVRGITREELQTDTRTQLALVRAITVVGEAARHMSEELMSANPDVPWKRIVGMRHRLVHDYFETDLEVVWITATVHIPELIELLEKITPPEPRST